MSLCAKVDLSLLTKPGPPSLDAAEQASYVAELLGDPRILTEANSACR